jgi:4'-phosphopantetheinyl transferase
VNGRLAAWQPAASWPGPDRHVVDVWQCPLRVPRGVFEARLASLTAAEQARAARFRREPDREAYVAMRGFLRERLAAVLAVAPQAVTLAEGPHGKPALAAPPPRWEFNVSHSGDIGLLALAWNRAVGVDVEQHRDNLDGPALAQRYFSPREIAALRQAPPEEQRAWFYALWTRKESFIKAVGQGLGFPLEKFSVTASPAEPPRLLALEGEPQPEAAWQMWEVAVDAGYSAALTVAAENGGTVRGWR